MNNFIYFCLFVTPSDRRLLFDRFIETLGNLMIDSDKDIKFNKGSMSHCTLLHHSQLKEHPDYYEELNSKIGYSFDITVDAIGVSDKAIAFRVKQDSIPIPCANKTPHITIATINDGKPVDSNSITNWITIEPILIFTRLRKIY